MAKKKTIPVGLATVAGMRCPHYPGRDDYKLSKPVYNPRDRWPELLQNLRDFGRKSAREIYELYGRYN
jgi:hypothetical protein